MEARTGVSLFRRLVTAGVDILGLKFLIRRLGHRKVDVWRGSLDAGGEETAVAKNRAGEGQRAVPPAKGSETRKPWPPPSREQPPSQPPDVDATDRGADAEAVHGLATDQSGGGPRNEAKREESGAIDNDADKGKRLRHDAEGGETNQSGEKAARDDVTEGPQSTGRTLRSTHSTVGDSTRSSEEELSHTGRRGDVNGQPGLATARPDTSSHAECTNESRESQREQSGAEEGTDRQPRKAKRITGGAGVGGGTGGIEPGHRGGKPAGPVSSRKAPGLGPGSVCHCRPEIVCWKRARQWIVAVEVPDRPGFTIERVSQGGVKLEKDERKRCWNLEHASGEVAVEFAEGESAGEKVTLSSDADCLLFKLIGQNQNKGRLVKSPSTGSYLVVAPSTWQRDHKLSGLPSVMPEPVSLPGFQAHFFELLKTGDQVIAFRNEHGEPKRIERKRSQFELVGTRLRDSHGYMGPLFGGEPPQIRARQEQAWNDIQLIVVGTEGAGKGKWRETFKPISGSRQQALPVEVATRRDGWYFLRFYDTKDELVESLDFRLVAALQDIRANCTPFPLAGEHQHAQVEFQHTGTLVVQPRGTPVWSTPIELLPGKTIVTLPPAPQFDDTRWVIGSEKPRVEIRVVTDRLWWAIGDENVSPSQWECGILSVSREDFSATSSKALWLQLPRPRWALRVLAGFEQSRARQYPMKVSEARIAIPLREFRDSQELSQTERDHFFNIWVERDGAQIHGIVAILPTSQGEILCISQGRKEKAVATAVLRQGNGQIRVNGRSVEEYFGQTRQGTKQYFVRFCQCGDVACELARLDMAVEVSGSNPKTVQQLKAAVHAMARALAKLDPQLEPVMKQQGFWGRKTRQ